MVPNPASVVKQSVMKQVIAKYLTENVGRGAGVVATSRLYLVITNFRIRVHLISPVVTNILW